MKQGIHPNYFEEATVICACGNTWKTGSTKKVIHTDVCSKCHPFYTGEQRIVDTEGQVDRFYKKLQVRKQYVQDKESREAARTSLERPIAEPEPGHAHYGCPGEGWRDHSWSCSGSPGDRRGWPAEYRGLWSQGIG